MNNIMLLVWLHFLGDFVLQNDKMALKKSTSNKWLAIHSIVYTIALLPFNFKFAILNGVFHFVVDWCSSKGTSYFWKRHDRHMFFVVIGFDQAIHMTVLFMSAYALNLLG